MGEDDDRNGPPTRGRRLLKLVGMTASVAGSYAGSKLKSAFLSAEAAALEGASRHRASGERIAQTLGELKGAVMKVGQMASIATDVLPKELAEALGRLQKEAPPVSYDVIRRQIQSELGSAPELLFHRFEEVPFASASIGQVHRARTDDGREVVVKVQYPGVDRSVDSDLTHLKMALRVSGLVHLDKHSLDLLFKEVRDRLVEELDYCNEADNVRKFRQFHAADHDIVIPEVVGEYSSARVLTLTYEPGDHVSKLDDARYPQAMRDQLAYTLYKMVSRQLWILHHIHADPNPANLAFRPDGRVVLYDFGCTKTITTEFLEEYRRLVRAALAEDYSTVDRGLFALGARRPGSSPLEASFYKPWRDALMRPWLVGGPYDFAASDIHEEVMRMLPGFLKHLTSFQPPAQLVFIDRTIVGHYGNLRALKARADFRALLDADLSRELQPA